MSRGFKSKHNRTMDVLKDSKTLIQQLFAERARRGAPNDDVKDISWKLQNTRLSDDEIFQIRAALRRMLLQPAFSDSSSNSTSFDSEKAMQFVKSMVCDPVQLKKLCRNAGYDGSNFLRSLAGEFAEAKAKGKKVEKQPQEWLRLQGLVRQAMRGERIASSFFQEPKAEPARGSREAGPPNSEDKILADIDALLGSDLLTGDEKDKLILYKKMIPVALSLTSIAAVQYVAEMKQEAAKRGGRAMERTSILGRCKALFNCGKLTIEEENALRDMRSDAQEGVNFANINSDLDKLEKRMAARNAKFDVEKALAEVLAPENAKYITFETLRNLKDSLPGRNRMASDWFNDRVAEAYAELNENKPRGKIANGAKQQESGAEDFESKKARIIGRIDKIISNLGMVAEKESAELAGYKRMILGITPHELELLKNIGERADAIARQYGIL